MHKFKFLIILFVFQQDNQSIYLCESCTETLVNAYSFSERIRLADERYLNSIRSTQETELEDTESHNVDIIRIAEQFESDEADALFKYEQDNIELLEVYTDSSEPEAKKTIQIQNKFIKNLPKKRQIMKLTKTTSPPKVAKSSKNTSLNIALPKFVITSESNSDDEDNGEPLDSYQDDERVSKPVNKIKTLNISAVVLSKEIMENESVDLQDICSSSAGITELKTVTDGDDSAQSIYKCKYCPKAYASAHHLMMHTRKVHMCQYCLAVFEKVSDLYKHSKETHKTFNCLMCDCVFRSNGNLRQHMRSYHSIFLPAYVSLLSVEKK